MPAMVLEFRSRGIQQLARDMQAAVAVGRQLAAVQNRLNSAGFAAGRGGSGSAGRSPAQVRVSGPYQQLARAQQALAQARNANEARDAQLAVQNVQNRINRLNQPPSSRLDKIGQLVSSSRLNMGGVSPLVGRALAALGAPASAATPLALFAAQVTIAVTAIKTLAQAADEGGKVLRGISTTAALTGGTGREAAVLRALGISSEFANSLRERLATDPEAQIAAARIGMRRVLPTQFGNQNNAVVVFDALERLRNIQRRGGNATREARLLGAENLLPLLNASDRATKSLRRTAGALGALADKTKVMSADWEAASRRMEAAQDRIKAATFRAVGPGATYFSNKFSDALDRLADLMEHFPDLVITGIETSIMGILGPVSAPLVVIFEELRKQLHTAQAANTNAINNNTNAVNNNTAYMKSGQIYGGGPRAQGAIPANLSGQNLNNVARNNGLRMSPW